MEEKARLEFRHQLEPKKTGTGKILGYVVMGGIGLFVLLWMIGSAMQQSETASNSPTRTDAIQTGNPAHDRLVALGTSAQASSPGQIAGEGCSGESAFYMGMDNETRAYWSVRCTNGRSYQAKFNRMRPGAPASLIAMFLRPSPACRVLRSLTNRIYSHVVHAGSLASESGHREEMKSLIPPRCPTPPDPDPKQAYLVHPNDRPR